MTPAVVAIFFATFSTLVFGQNCSTISTCELCYQQRGACAWCASDALGNGYCLGRTLDNHPIGGNCTADYWNRACCSGYRTCDSCSNSKQACTWCDSTSKINAGRCLPHDGTGAAHLGGCTADHYSNWCCRDLTTCDACNKKGWRCAWCNAGSTVNPGTCLPWGFSTGDPRSGGCSSGYYYGTCPQDYQTCNSCLTSNLRVGWCDGTSRVNPNKCLATYFGDPSMGGCDAGHFQKHITSCDKNCSSTCVSCQKGTCTSCVVGYYGSQCDKKCSPACDTLGGCEQETGNCFGCQESGACGTMCEEKCQNGWGGCKECDQGCGKCTECKEGLVGADCKSACVNCLNFQCDENGECEFGCVNGWSGPQCSTPCSAECSGIKICVNDQCVCPPGYHSGLFGCGKSNLGLTCDECKKLASAAKLATDVSHSYASYEEAAAALETVSCFFLPPPLDLGCAVVMVEEGVGYAIVSQITDELLTEGFCSAWGSC